MKKNPVSLSIIKRIVARFSHLLLCVFIILNPFDKDNSTLYSMKIKEQTRKLGTACSKHNFEAADKTDKVTSKHCFEVGDRESEQKLNLKRK